jgi:putative endonuclease
MPDREYNFFVYIVASRSLQIYVGVTNSLERRMREHKAKIAGSYTARYNIDRLVYFECFQYVLNAIARETDLKGWNRAKKIALVESVNPTWVDLSQDWGESVRRFHRAASVDQRQNADSSATLRNDNNREFVPE